MSIKCRGDLVVLLIGKLGDGSDRRGVHLRHELVDFARCRLGVVRPDFREPLSQEPSDTGADHRVGDETAEFGPFNRFLPGKIHLV